MKLVVGLRAYKDSEYLSEVIMSCLLLADKIIIGIDAEADRETREIAESFNCNVKTSVQTFLIPAATKIGMCKSKMILLEMCRAHNSDWIFFLDADEVLSDNAIKIREYLINPDVDVWNIRGHHFIYNLGLEDATVDKHYWTARLFRNLPEIHLEGDNHEILTGYDITKTGIIEDVRIFHMGYVKHLQKIRDKYNKDIQELQIHSTNFLLSWKNSHLLGTYPTKPCREPLPRVLREKFRI